MKQKYNQIREQLNYEEVTKSILPYLGRVFSTREFYELFLLRFNNNKYNYIMELGLKRLIWWLHIYYLPRMGCEKTEVKRCIKNYEKKVWINPKSL